MLCQKWEGYLSWLHCLREGGFWSFKEAYTQLTLYNIYPSSRCLWGHHRIFWKSSAGCCSWLESNHWYCGVVGQKLERWRFFDFQSESKQTDQSKYGERYDRQTKISWHVRLSIQNGIWSCHIPRMQCFWESRIWIHVGNTWWSVVDQMKTGLVIVRE